MPAGGTEESGLVGMCREGRTPTVSWMAGPVTQRSLGPGKTSQGWEQDTVVTDVHTMQGAGETSAGLSFPSVKL